MTAGTGAAEHPIGAHLRGAGITKALIIDDAFDPPTRDTYAHELADFWERVQRDPSALEELQRLKAGISSATDIDEEVFGHLWERRDLLATLGPLLKDGLFIGKLGELAALAPLSDHLAQLGIESVRVGSEQALPEEKIKLVFIDYILGPGAAAESVRRANIRAKEINSKVPPNEDKPFFVLMSSKPDAEAAKDNFRDASGLLGGLFGYVPKEDLRDKEKLYLRLATWAIAMPTRHEIQHFVEALEASAESARKDFVQRVRGLGFDDYVSIQWLSLQPDGKPLGEYMLWLYKSLFAYLLHNNAALLKQQKKLDAMSFEEFMACQAAPSLQLAEMYWYALTEPGIEEIGPHPRAGTDPILCLGDLLFKDQAHEVVAVINAACDLSYSPGTKTRPFPGDRSIVLLHGTLQRYEDIDSSTSTRTELFKHDGRVHRILWDHRRITSMAYSEVTAWLKAEGYSRKTRLALPYALQIQQSFALGMLRVGTPIRPPVFRQASVEMYFSDEAGNCQLAAAGIENGAVIIRHKIGDAASGEDLFILTLDCIAALVGLLDKVIESHELQKAALVADKTSIGTGKTTGLIGKLAKLADLKRLSQDWVSLIKSPQRLPSPTNKIDVNTRLRVYYDRSFDGKYNEGGLPVVLNIKPKAADVPDTPETAQPSPAEIPPRSAQAPIVAEPSTRPPGGTPS